MKKFYMLVLLISASATYAQIRFEKGYFIDNSGLRTECLIRNNDWKDSPTEFTYKLSEEGQTASKSKEEVSEFGFADTKYISIETNIDRSSEKLEFLSNQREPEFKKERLFLRVLVDGSAKLYHYSLNAFHRYFYSVGSGPVKQLVYKRYYIDSYRIDMAENNAFRQQLFTEVFCKSANIETIQRLSYQKNDLVNYFEKVNECNDGTVVKKDKNRGRGFVNFKISAITGSHSLAVSSTVVNQDFENKIYFTGGAEVEYILPLMNNKWAIALEPTFNSYKAETTDEELTLDAEYKYFRVSAVARHYLHFSGKLKMFLNAGINYDNMLSGSKIDFTNFGYDTMAFAKTSITFLGGVGVNVGPVSAEARLNAKSNPTPYGTIDYNYQNISFHLRYKLFGL